jgi:viroplasmin and RNaseH domain-containing protein
MRNLYRMRHGLYLEHVAEIAMAWYVVFHGWKPRVYESWGVCSEYIVGFSGTVFQSYSTRMQDEEAYQSFLEHIAQKGEHVSTKWCQKDWVILVQFIVIIVLWYRIM